MGEKILVPVDGSESSWKALGHAIDHYSVGELVALHVVDPAQGDYYEADDRDEVVRRSDEILDEARDRFSDATESLETGTDTITGKPSSSILDYAEANDFDHIVMGSRGQSGLKRLLLGSVAETVVRRSDIPVTIVR